MSKSNRLLSSFTKYFRNEPANRDQLIKFLRNIHAKNIIDADTLDMLEGVILLSQLKVRDIMLPKNQMICITTDASSEEAIRIINQSGHSRFPLIENNKDNVVGIVHAKDLLRFYNLEDNNFDLLDIARQVSFVPESKRLDSLLAEFKNNRNHMAIVVDEYGEVAGFVTLEDILEQIIGDIEDEFDIDEEAYIKVHGDNHYIVKAHTPIEEFNEQLRANFSGESYDTIGGIVTTNFGYLPKRGETIELEGFKFKILNADARRIKLLECIDNRSTDSQSMEIDYGI